MVNSMTGFAARQGQMSPFGWSWELRGVNARGFDFRPRVPDWIAGLEQGLRALVAADVSRGNVSLSLRLQRVDALSGLQINTASVDTALSGLRLIEDRAQASGIILAPTTAAGILQMKGVQETTTHPEDTAPLRAALLADFAPLLEAFNQMRAAEGAALQTVVLAQLSAIKTLVQNAQSAAQARHDGARVRLAEGLARILENSDGADPDRLAQELALMAVKSDITEELDRLRAHGTAACALLRRGNGTVGRKLDFLCQEFMREANTMCSKAQDRDLVAIGLDLKVVIDQMREQIQNME